MAEPVKLTLSPGLVAFCAVGLLATVGFGLPDVSPITNPVIRHEELNAHDESASGSLLGQFRTNISSWLWVRTDLYLHNGVQMRPITDREEKSGVTVDTPAAGSGAIRTEKDVTAIPSPERDFRGVFGDVERAVNAWKDMKNHSHSDPRQSLPLFRLMTWIDPQFIEGWTTGASVFTLDNSSEGTTNALSFLFEGLKENPDSVDILTEIGAIEVTRKQDLRSALPYLERARHTGFEHKSRLVENERNALEADYRWLAFTYRNLNEDAKMRQVAEEGLSLFPDDRPLERTLMETPSILVEPSGISVRFRKRTH